MTTKQGDEILAHLYALGEAIRIKDWPNALPRWERLLSMYSPLAEWHPELARVLRREAAMVQLAGRQSTKTH